jgi:hypothetical protein
MADMAPSESWRTCLRCSHPLEAHDTGGRCRVSRVLHQMVDHMEGFHDWSDDTDWDADGICACQQFEWHDTWECSCGHRIGVHVAALGPEIRQEGRKWRPLIRECKSPGCGCSDFHP